MFRYFSGAALLALSSLSFAITPVASFGTGATVAAGDGWRTAYANPALLQSAHTLGEDDVTVSFGVRIEETPEFRKASRHFEHTFRAFDESAPYSYLNNEQREGFLDELESLDGNEHITEINYSTGYLFHTDNGHPLAFTLTSRIIGHLKFNYDPADRDRYINPVLTPELYELTQQLNPDIGSHMDMNSVALTDLGISTGFSTDIGFSVGGKLKLQAAHLLHRKVVYEDYVDPHYSDYLSEHYRPTADLGVHQVWGKDNRWSAGVLLMDLGSWEQISVEGQTFEVVTLPLIAMAWRGDQHSVQFQAALDTQFDFGILQGTKPINLQYEYRPMDSAIIRVGLRHDQLNFKSNSLQFATIYQPFESLGLEFQIEANDNNGFGLGLGFNIAL